MELDIQQMAPPSGRRNTLVKALEYVHRQRSDSETLIVEVGTTRDGRPKAQYADGWATLVFGWYASELDGRVITIDSDRNALATCERVTKAYRPWIIYQRATRERGTGEILSRIDTPISLLYLDGPHGRASEHDKSARVHLEWYQALKQQPSLILIDDCRGDDYGVKGRLAVPAALEDGYRILFHEGYQIALVLK